MDGCIYGDICNTYVSYVLNTFGKCTVCFDGYYATSTKFAEQNQHGLFHTVSADMIVDFEHPVTTNQRSFLANRTNKSQLIEEVKLQLSSKGVKCQQAEADADYILTSTTTSYAEVHTDCPVALVGTDADLLVMLIDKVTCKNVYIM